MTWGVAVGMMARCRAGSSWGGSSSRACPGISEEIPAFAGMTWVEVGMTGEPVGMTGR